MKSTYQLTLSALLLTLLLAACGPTINQIKPQPTATVDKSFQAQVSPIPTIPPYRCGAWSSNNAPGANSTISIYAKLTKDVTGVSGAKASAVVHFQDNDVTLDQQPVSDGNGYVSFSLPLQGRQPHQVPATVDVTFTVGGTTVHCSPAFFTPN
ncbi:MAG: hypothetical protein JOZ18_03540 [Chloroflexi bacterium]|nr:hypothetical protein [Chloroflexota bacterium]